MTRAVDLADADPWVEETRQRLGRNDRYAIVAVLPDAEEVALEPIRWRLWFSRSASMCFHSSRGAPVVFVATDRRTDGRWIDKATILNEARPHIAPGLTLHRIALRRAVGVVDLKRPTYSHVLAYGGRPGERTPDVFYGGQPLWRNGIGVGTAREIATWLAQQDVDGVLNPFCGAGTILAACGELGIPSYGCDTDAGRVEIARALDLSKLPDHRKDPVT